MRVPFSFSNCVRLVVALAVMAGAGLLLSSDDQPAFTAQDKAYYADANTLNYIRPGLVFKIVSASIADDGTTKVRFTVKDPNGIPLDREGIVTAGPISTSWVLATIPRGKTQYTAYTTRVQTSPITGRKETQASSDSGGTYDKVADGEYVYNFKTKAPAGFDKGATHTIAAWAGRNLAEFEMVMQKNYDATTYTWVPDGSAGTGTRDVIRTETCNKCHDPLAAHGNRRKIEVCIVCHTPQTIDPDTGETVDMPVMIHKIHMGKDLPSVKAGKKYVIIGHVSSSFPTGTPADFSTVGLPVDARTCTHCHESTTGAAQADAWLKPSRAACGSCHDNVNFATGENHLDLPQISDNQCASCHWPEGELEFDASIKGAHVIPTRSREMPGTVFDIKQVDDGVAGKSPTVTFTVKTRDGKGIDIPGMRLQIVIAGPTADYASYISEDVTKAQKIGDGEYKYTFTYKIPADAKGTFAAGIEGYKSVTIMKGFKSESTQRDAGINKVVYFSVDGSAVAPRRTVVSVQKCNACHGFLSLHGGNRNQIEQCVLCHAPNITDAAVRPKDHLPAQSIQFANMVHRIHTGEHAEGGGDYIIYGRGGSVNNFGEVRYPGDRRNCNACHVNGSEQPPLGEALLQVQNPRGVLSPMGPTTAACTGCHTEVYTASHALSNTTEKLGEACGACHSTNYEFGIPKMHAR